MAWNDPKQPAVDPDNPEADEQVTADEWNAMVDFTYCKIIGKEVDDTAILDGRILVYDFASDTFIFEDQQAVPELIGDLDNVTISGVPADNEVLAYDTGSTHWINQTAAEAGLATVTDLASYLALAGGTMAGALNMGDYLIDDVDDIQAFDTGGIAIRDSAASSKIVLATTTYAFTAYANANMNSSSLLNVTDPTSAQDASTKNYDDTHLFTKEAVTSFLDGYIPVYRTLSGKFEMEEQITGPELIGDLDNVTISGVPADNEVLAYDTGLTHWINQTAAEAGLATVTDLASYLPLAGGTVAGALILDGQVNMGAQIVMAEYYITGVTHIQPHSTTITIDGILDMATHGISNVVDPTSAQQAATKNYDDTHLFTKEAVTSFLDGYIPVYHTASGKFEMEEQSAALGLPVADTTAIVKGSVDGTKLMRFEVDGLTTGTTRVMTVPDKNITLCDTAEVHKVGRDIQLSGYGLSDVGGILLYPPMELVIVSGVVTISKCYHTIDTESDAATDDLDTINGGVAGDLLLLHPANFTRTVVLKNGTGNLLISGDFSMEDTVDSILLIYLAGYWLEVSRSNINHIQKVILKDAMELTIATGVVTATQSYHTIDTEGDIASDDLDTISGGTAGQVLVIRAADSARTVVVKDSTAGAANLALEGDMSLDNAEDTISLLYDGTNWLETARSNNGV